MADIQSDFHNYMSEEMIDNRYDRLMMQRAEGRRKKIVDSDGNYVDEKKPIFGRINGDPRYGISLHTTPTKKSRKKRDGAETQYLLQGECKVFQKKTTRVCSDCADTDEVRNEIWVCHPKTNRPFFSQNVHSTHDL